MGGALICILGLACIVITDTVINETSSASNALMGDIFCLIGAVLYASSNVLQEHIVKSHDRHEYMGIVGVFAAIIALIQCLILDLHAIQSTHFTLPIVLYIIGFVVCLFLMYTNTSMFLVESDATLFNLSLLTSDVYAVIFSYFMTGSLVYWTYFLAFGCVAVGLFIYHSEKPPMMISLKMKSIENRNEDLVYSPLDNVSSHSPLNSNSDSAHHNNNNGVNII